MEGCPRTQGVTPTDPRVGSGSIQPPLPHPGTCPCLAPPGFRSPRTPHNSGQGQNGAPPSLPCRFLGWELGKKTPFFVHFTKQDLAKLRIVVLAQPQGSLSPLTLGSGSKQTPKPSGLCQALIKPSIHVAAPPQAGAEEGAHPWARGSHSGISGVPPGSPSPSSRVFQGYLILCS